MTIPFVRCLPSLAQPARLRLAPARTSVCGRSLLPEQCSDSTLCVDRRSPTCGRIVPRINAPCVLHALSLHCATPPITVIQVNPPAHRIIIRGDWPFDVRRLPIFYGWVVWLVSTIGFLMSIPGQTMGMAVFTDTFIEVLGLTRTQLSTAYFVGTVTSAFFLTRAGRLYDRVGARIITIASAVALALTLIVIAVLDELSAFVAMLTGMPLAAWSFPAIMMCYFGVRFAGQGVLTSASRNVLLVWFEKRRGLVSGARGVFVSLGFSISPLIIATMIAGYGWRGALFIMAVTIGIGYTLIAMLFLRDNPESCGVLPDGMPTSEDDDERVERPDLAIGLAEARASAAFWAYALGLAAYGLFITAVTFHIVAIFAEAGRGSSEAFAYFLPQAIVSTCVNLLASWLADTRGLKPFLLVLLLGLICGTAGILYLDGAMGYAMMVCGYGIGAGLWGVIANLSFIRHFGRAHLGEITGLNMAVSVFASAIGPVFFSVAYDAFGTYHAPVYMSIAAAALLLGAAMWAELGEPSATNAS